MHQVFDRLHSLKMEYIGLNQSHTIMKPLNYLLTNLFLVVSLTSCQADNNSIKVLETAPEEPTEKVMKSEEEWKKILTPEQFRVARKAGTEPAFGAIYKQFSKQDAGDYHCVGCGAKLFTSKEKFDSGSGWPSFYDVAVKENVVTKVDNSHGWVRTEILCAKCDAHLGHLFTGENYSNPTDKRYCVNGVVLDFVPENKGTETKKDTEKETTTEENKK